MNAPGHGTQPSSDCVNCGRSNCWYEPACKHCGLNLWTNTFEPLDKYFARRFPAGGTPTGGTDER